MVKPLIPWTLMTGGCDRDTPRPLHHAATSLIARMKTICGQGVSHWKHPESIHVYQYVTNVLVAWKVNAR